MAVVTASERQEIEDYLKTYCLEACLDEAINEVVEKRPENPYMLIASCMESKTMPEIIQVYLYPIVVGEGLGGVEAVIETNISKFSGYVSYPAKTYSKENLILRDFTGIQEVVRGHLRRLDPFNLPEFDNVLSKIPGLDTTISLALSMACCRASARHKAIPLYKFIAEIAGTYDKMKIPTPVVSVLNCTPDIDLPARQEISLIATSSTTLDNALEALLRASLHIREKLSTSSQMTITMMDGGCPCVVVPTLSQAAQFVHEAVKELDLEGASLKLAIDVKSGIFISDDHKGYQFNGIHGDFKTGEAVVEMMRELWISSECVSIEDPFHYEDEDSLLLFHDRINHAVQDAKVQYSADKLPLFVTRGVGGDETCPLQIVNDYGCVGTEDLHKYFEKSQQEDRVFNCIKIKMLKIGSITKAIEMCNKARELGWSVIIGHDDGITETQDSFLADLAVGLGAGQLAAGGVASGEYISKYNRLLEILRSDEMLSFSGSKFRR